MSKVTDGFTYREHLEKKASGRNSVATALAREELEGGPDLPYALSYLWVWFLQLAAGRSSGGMGGIANISFADIVAWSTLMKTSPAPHEVEALMSLDIAFRNAQIEDD